MSKDENIQIVEYSNEFGQMYVDYAMSVITDRALADVRDGLKPAQRRILFALDQLTTPNGPYRKCARIVGDTMGKYHPHGDSSIYDALVRLSQEWKLPIPLITPGGNFGSIDGAGAAAMRYTEARISQYIEDVCMKNLSYIKDEFVLNFDGTEDEPSCLPFLVPNILVSGTSGIAVGMASEIPSHNLGEVIDATIAYMNNPDITTEELLDIMHGPDFATGGYINASKEDLIEAYETGRKKIKVRGKVEVRDIGRGRKSICVTELPYTMVGATQKYLQTVVELTRNRVLSNIVDIADRGDKNGECLCIDVKKGTTDEEIENIINILYKKTGLEDTYGIILIALVNGEPKVLGLRDILYHFMQYKNEIYQTKYQKLLAKELENKEVKEGLLTAVDCIDLIIEILRGSKKVADVKACLMNGDTSKIKFRYKGSEEDAKQLCFTEKQADAILSMRLQKLIGLEIEALKKDLDACIKLINKYEKMLSDSKIMQKQMISDMLEIKDKYAIPRRTVIKDFGEVTLKQPEEVAQEVAVLLDRFFYIKVIDRSVYDKNKEQIEKDYRYAIPCENTDRVCIFTDDGVMHMIKLQDVIKQQNKKTVQKKKENNIFAKLSDKGVQIFELCNMTGEENILLFSNMSELVSKNLLFIHKNGYGKQVEGRIFDVSRKNIVAANQDSSLVYVGITQEQVILKSKNGYYLRLNTEDISFKGKLAAGSRLMKLKDEDVIEQVWNGNTKDYMVIDDKEIPFTRIALAKRDAIGTKVRI